MPWRLRVYTYIGFLSMVVLGLFLCGTVAAQDHSAHTQAKPATLMQGYGDLHHPVSTSNPQAQQFFDQGVRQIYAFNHDEAARSFQRAADLDPKLAMAYWGVAEAVGPNYNDPASDARFATAHTAIQKAVDLSGSASPAEQAPHAGSRLHTHRRLRSGGQNQPGSGGSRSSLHQGEWRAGHLPPDVLQSQPALHRHVFSHEWRLL